MSKKLVIANNQRENFVSFHRDIQADEPFYDYVGYRSLLFEFGVVDGKPKILFLNSETGDMSDAYGGVYLNGYLDTVELATTAAVVLDAQHVTYVNKELGHAPSLTKLSAYAKLAAEGVQIPYTFGGAAYALLAGFANKRITLDLPFILKRADADRGVDNYKISSYEQAEAILKDQPERSIWVAQEFIPNDGFYLVSFYHGKPEFGIFRSMGERKDKREELSHMFKPKGGQNATLLDIAKLPGSLLDTSVRATRALDRQFASVDSIYVPETDLTYVLEVNYNPQLVTIETFKDTRKKAFLDAMKRLGS